MNIFHAFSLFAISVSFTDSFFFAPAIEARPSNSSFQTEEGFVKTSFNELLKVQTQEDLVEWISKNADIPVILARTLGTKMKKFNQDQKKLLITIWPDFMSKQLFGLLKTLKEFLQQGNSIEIKYSNTKGAVSYYNCQVKNDNAKISVSKKKTKISNIQLGDFDIIQILRNTIAEIEKSTKIKNCGPNQIIEGIQNYKGNTHQ